jgi:pimeloyl-ACP methyl ester carboxylesterase
MTVGRERIIDLDGPLRIVEYGDGRGPLFVCVHGLGGSALDWQVLAPRLAARARVVALDLPGFGDTPLGRRTTTVAELQGLLDRFLDRYAAGPVVLVGNSMGGMVTLLQATARPGAVARLVLLAPALPVSARRLPHPLTTAQFLAYAVRPLGEWYIRARSRYVDPRTMADASLGFLTAHPERVPETIYEQRAALLTRLTAGADSERALLSAARSLLRELALPAYRHAIRNGGSGPAA